MKKVWFVRTKRFYRPFSFYGWLITLAALAYIAFSVFRILSKSFNLYETITDIALQVILTAAIYVFIAYLTQKR